jgi:peptidoglycan-N-acetylglucosamine deacetylase
MKSFYLTFDGAPNPPGTDNILKLLAEYDVIATFFIEGHRLEHEADCALRVQSAGHDIGNHSYTHPEFDSISVEAACEEIKRADDILQEKLGIRPRICRPPAGKLTPEVEKAIVDLGYTIVLWSYSNRDWETPDVDVLVDRVMSGIRDQAIVVFHDHVPWVPDVLKIIIPAIHSAGYEYKKISDFDATGVIR